MFAGQMLDFLKKLSIEVLSTKENSRRDFLRKVTGLGLGALYVGALRPGIAYAEDSVRFRVKEAAMLTESVGSIPKGPLLILEFSHANSPSWGTHYAAFSVSENGEKFTQLEVTGHPLAIRNGAFSCIINGQEFNRNKCPWGAKTPRNSQLMGVK